MSKTIERTEVRRLIATEAAQVVEVLPRDEYASEHIAGAINIPLKKIGEHAGELLDRSRPVIVYCHDFQ